jgi:acyl-CoA thioester hydrolase
MPNKFTFQYLITKENIDFNGHLGNLEYIKLGLKAAADHWHSVANDEYRKLCLWIVKRHEIDYISEVFEGAQLEITTEIIEVKGAVSKRTIEIMLGEKKVCSMITEWYLLNGTNKKPMRITDDIAGLFL